MGRVVKDLEKRKAMRAELYEKIDRGEVTPQEAVKTLRQIAGLSQTEFAKKVKVSLVSLKAIESGAGNPTIKTLMRLLSIGGLTLIAGRKSKTKT
jgi:DNA-binding XRE family transcriptional regulator